MLGATAGPGGTALGLRSALEGHASIARRLAALRHSGLLDTPPEPGFDRITALVRQILDVPVAHFSLIDADRQFFKSQASLHEPATSERETPLSHSFCKYVVASGAPLVVEDARREVPLRDSPAVRELGVLAYLGAPVRHPSGVFIGALCAYDYAPRSWTEREVDMLRTLADSVECEVALRVERANREWAELEAQAARHHTDAVAAAAEVRRETEELALLKGAILSNMSHEIRTPLTGILGYADLLAEEAPADLAGYAATIQRNASRLLDTLSAVLDFAQLEAGQTLFLPQRVDVAERAAAAVALWAPLAEGKGLALSLEIPEDGADVETDPRLVDRVLRHLVDNALKFTSEGGVRVRVVSRADAVRLDVVDTGAGIPTSFLPHLFEEFRQESVGYARLHEGSGLGLPITKRLVDLMGGRLAVSSRVGTGSTFSVTLPRSFTPPRGSGSESCGFVKEGVQRGHVQVPALRPVLRRA